MGDNFKPDFGNWVPKNRVQQFFNYGNTVMNSFAEKYNIRKSKSSNR